MSAIRNFVDSLASLSDKPQHYVLTSGDGAIIATFSIDDDPASNIEKAIRQDLAFVTGPCNYTLMAQDAAGGVKHRIQLRQHGTAPKTAAGEAASVNGNLVALVGKLSSSSLEHFERLYDRQDEVITALLGANKDLSRTLAECMATDDGPVPANPAVSMAEQRVSRLIEVGVGAAVKRLTGGDEKPVSTAAVGGKHARLRELIASLSDEEIDRIIAVILASGAGEGIMGALGEANLAQALEILGGA